MHILFTFVTLLTFALELSGQTTPPPSSSYKVADGSVDLAVPESPAFTALGVTPQTIARPTSPRDLATSFLNGVDPNGNFQTGVAIDTALYMLLAGRTLTLERYQQRNQYLTRFLARWQTSFATTKGGSDDDKSAKLALGFRFTVLDLGDPRGDKELLSCLSNEAGKVLTSLPPVPPGADLDVENEKREEAVRSATRPCREASAKKRWNKSSWILGVAPTWTSPDGRAINIAHSGTGIWSSIGFGFESVPLLERHTMIVAHFRYRTHEVVPDRFKPENKIEQNSTVGGGRFLFGTSSTQAHIEGVYVRNQRADALKDRYWRIVYGFERRLIDNTWLTVSLGRELARRKEENNFYVLASFNWALARR